jgi:hypothetical protein
MACGGVENTENTQKTAFKAENRQKPADSAGPVSNGISTGDRPPMRGGKTWTLRNFWTRTEKFIIFNGD